MAHEALLDARALIDLQAEIGAVRHKARTSMDQARADNDPHTYMCERYRIEGIDAALDVIHERTMRELRQGDAA